MCAVTPATVPRAGAETPTLDIFNEREQRTDLDFVKGNVHGALLDNLDSANGVSELTPTVKSWPKHYAVMFAFLVVCPSQDNSSRCTETEYCLKTGG